MKNKERSERRRHTHKDKNTLPSVSIYTLYSPSLSLSLPYTSFIEYLENKEDRETKKKNHPLSAPHLILLSHDQRSLRGNKPSQLRVSDLGQPIPIHSRRRRGPTPSSSG